jgi:hypothetical protein
MMPDTKVIETLKAARELISVPERWTQHDYARDRDGYYVAANDKAAVCWCSLGALLKASEGGGKYSAAKNALSTAIKGSVVEFNDTHKHPEILAAFDKAIELAEKEASHG